MSCDTPDSIGLFCRNFTWCRRRCGAPCWTSCPPTTRTRRPSRNRPTCRRLDPSSRTGQTATLHRQRSSLTQSNSSGRQLNFDCARYTLNIERKKPTILRREQDRMKPFCCCCCVWFHGDKRRPRAANKRRTAKSRRGFKERRKNNNNGRH